MTSISVAARIWAKTVAIGIIIFGIAALFAADIWMLISTGLVLVFGFFVTSPLLIVISPLVKLSARLPYDNRSKMNWLIFSLFLMYMLIFILVGRMMAGRFECIISEEGSLVILSVIFVQFIAVRTTRKSLYKFYDQP